MMVFLQFCGDKKTCRLYSVKYCLLIFFNMFFMFNPSKQEGHGAMYLWSQYLKHICVCPALGSVLKHLADTKGVRAFNCLRSWKT